MVASIVENDTAAKFGNSPQKIGEPLDHATLYSGKGLEFDGVSDYLSLPSVKTYSSTDFTYAVWFYSTQSTPYLSGHATNNYVRLSSSSNLLLKLQCDAGSDNYNITTNWNTNTWHRLVITRESNVLKSYIDGAYQGTVTVGAAVSENSTDFDTSFIGKRSGTTGYFGGMMCDFQLWSKAWQLDDVTYDYLNPETLITGNASVTAGITTSDLDYWYPMNDTGVRSPQTVVFDAAGTNITTKNHATTTFYGDMTDLIADDASNGANLYNTANTKYDFTTESTASGTDTYDVLGNSHWTGINATAAITTGESDTGMEIKNTGASVGSIRSGAITTVSGRTYQLDITHTPTSESHVDVDLGVYAGTSAGGSQYISVSNQSDGTYSGTFVATGAELHLTLAVISSLINKVVRVRTFQLREIGIASGWTEADQQQTIPQTALMNGSTKYEFDGASTEVHMDLAAFTNKSDFSMSAWIFPYGSDFSGIVCGNGEDTNERVMGVQSRLLSFTNYNSDGYGSPDSLRATGNPLPSGGYVWTHIVLTYADSGSTIKWYVNGAEHTSTDTGGGWSAQTDTTASNIGFLHRSGGQNYFKGLIDEVSYWNDDLTAAQVSALYNSGTPLNATKSAAASNLVGYWRNNALESTGKWEDLSTNNNHATATNLGGSIFFQEGVTANLDTQGFDTNIDHTGSKGAVYFDGVEDYIDLGKTITIEGEFTLEFWLKTDNPGTTENYIMGLNSNDFIFIDDNNTIKLEMNGSTETLDINDVGYHATDTLLVNEWVHIAITRNSDNVIKLYVNSQVQTDTSTTADNFDFRYIGFDGDSNYFKGWLDEFKVYDKELTSGLVGKNYKHGKSKHKNS